jgi:hypothetical protein
MEAKLKLHYEREGDILYIDKVPPYSEQESQEVGDGVVVRTNPSTGAVENVELLFFSSRFQNSSDVEIPVSVDLRVVRSA